MSWFGVVMGIVLLLLLFSPKLLVFFIVFVLALGFVLFASSE